MAINTIMMKALCSRLKPGARIASMGYPDMIAPLDVIEEFIGDGVRSLDFLKDSPAICKRHNIPFRGIPDAFSVFKKLGAELDVFDIVKERDCEIPYDLNEPQCAWDFRYDFVLDVGTLEHCFNIGQAALNMVSLLKVGGIIFHENPFNWGNHGFYNMNPTWYADFYSQRGFKLLECKLVTKDGRSSNVPQTDRFQFVQEEINVFAVAERTRIMPITWPMQTKYVKMIAKAGLSGEAVPALEAIGA